MSIECYYSQCSYHSCRYAPDDGPFCDEAECRASEQEIQTFGALRQKYLDSLKSGPLAQSVRAEDS